jgi:hypothetical protein
VYGLQCSGRQAPAGYNMWAAAYVVELLPVQGALRRRQERVPNTHPRPHHHRHHTCHWPIGGLAAGLLLPLPLLLQLRLHLLLHPPGPPARQHTHVSIQCQLENM